MGRTVALAFLVALCAAVGRTDDEDFDPCKSAGIVQGDIAVAKIESGPRRKRAATAFKNRLWRDGVIPFEIDSVYTGEQRATIIQAIKHWENATCLSFVEHNNEKDYIFFNKGGCGCCSYVGRKGNGRQGISIGKNCDKFGIVVHEIGHVVGFWHEHTRPDRNQFVSILSQNIKKGEEHNFNKLSIAEINSRNEPYDYGSIMHYGKNTFAETPNYVTILPRRDSLINAIPEIGQRNRLSAGDIRQTVKMYHCPECGQTLQGSRGSFASPGYPRHYLQEKHCEWRISLSPGQRIVMNFTHFSLNKASRACRDSDYVEVRDGHMRSSRLIGRYCGTAIPAPVSSTTSRLWIKFKSGSKPDGATGFKATYKAICGGQIKASKGSIQSPNFPEWYPSNTNCIWTISVSKASIVAVRFYAFDVEGDRNCSYDYLQVFDGDGVAAPSLGRFCGKSMPPEIKGISSRLTIKFASDTSINKAGFHLKFFSETNECSINNGGCEQICQDSLGAYHCACVPGYELSSNKRNCEETCGGIFLKPNGTITSPGFPVNYPKNKRCVWEISASRGQMVSLEFKVFHLEGKADAACAYDYVEVRESKEKSLGKFCGSSLPPIITSSSNIMRIEFRSDQTQSRKGFSAVYRTDEDECQKDNGRCQHQCVNTIGSYHCTCREGFALEKDKHGCKEVSECGSSVTGLSGQITSPNFPNAYPPNKDCTWKITVTPGSHVQLSFMTMNIEEENNGCPFDKVQLYSGSNSQAQTLGQFCGSNPPGKPVVSRAHKMMVKFHSDAKVNEKGFRARYTAVCGAYLSASIKKRTFYSHPAHGRKDYEPKLKCHWYISTRAGSVIRLRFKTLELESETHCSYDSVVIRDGNSTRSPFLGRLCGSTGSRQEFTSTGNKMWVRFSSDKTTQKKGFVAEYFRVRKKTL